MVTHHRTTRARRIFAESIKRLRTEQELSQEALAAQANLHRTYIGSIERGERNVSIDNMQKLADALGVRVYDLLLEDTK